MSGLQASLNRARFQAPSKIPLATFPSRPLFYLLTCSLLPSPFTRIPHSQVIMGTMKDTHQPSDNNHARISCRQALGLIHPFPTATVLAMTNRVPHRGGRLLGLGTRSACVDTARADGMVATAPPGEPQFLQRPERSVTRSPVWYLSHAASSECAFPDCCSRSPMLTVINEQMVFRSN